MKPHFHTCSGLWAAAWFCAPLSLLAAGPRPGDIYREYSRTMGQTNSNWRVTDPNVKEPRAQKHLSNALLHIDIDDLEGASRAEVLIDRWGGHAGTSNKKLRFNGHDWIVLPELTTTPPGRIPDNYVYQDNPVIAIPLEHLREGDNTFEGTCDDPEYWWPQWGWDGIVIRVYYHRDKPHPSGRIISPAAGEDFGDQPLVRVHCAGRVDIERVDVLAYYDGFDEDGDGVFQEWHRHYWCLRNAEKIDIRYHVGSDATPPYQVVWDTHWLPDQAAKAIRLLARIRDSSGIWYVTDTIDGLSLKRHDFSVKYYTATDIPYKFSTRNGQVKSCTITIPETEPLHQAATAILHMRTWNGTPDMHDAFEVNGYAIPLTGNNHNYDYDIYALPVKVLRLGKNTITFYSQTEHHGVEVLWPGPAISVRFQRQ